MNGLCPLIMDLRLRTSLHLIGPLDIDRNFTRWWLTGPQLQGQSNFKCVCVSLDQVLPNVSQYIENGIKIHWTNLSQFGFTNYLIFFKLTKQDHCTSWIKHWYEKDLKNMFKTEILQLPATVVRKRLSESNSNSHLMWQQLNIWF